MLIEQGVYPIGPPKQDGSSHLFEGLDGTQLLSLEILLSFVGAMADRLEEGDEKWSVVSFDVFANSHISPYLSVSSCHCVTLLYIATNHHSPQSPLKRYSRVKNVKVFSYRVLLYSIKSLRTGLPF